MGWRTTFTVAFFLLGLTGFSAWAQKRVAVVIGNSAYENIAKLANPANDAAAIADALKNAGFDTVALNRDVGAADMKRALDELSGKSGDADMAVVYFAGHSIDVDGMTYLAPVDVASALGEAIALDRLLQSIQSAKQLRLIIVDACHGNPFVRGTSRAGCTPSRDLAATVSVQPNTVVAFAAKAGSAMRDGTEKNSPFTAALLRHLTAPGLDLQQVLTRVREDVMKATANGQEPYVVGSLSTPSPALVASAATPMAQGASPSKAVTQGAAVKPQREDPSKVDALDRVRIAMEAATAERIARDRTEAETRAAKARDQAEATGSIRGGEKDAARQIAALPAGAGGFAQRELNRSLQVELHRVGCQTGPASDEWTAASRRSLELFNKHAGLKLEIKLASADALDAVKSRQARVCP
jgi:Caspase domain